MQSKQKIKAVTKKNELKLIISKINITLKFSCWLYIEYNVDGYTCKSPQIKVDPKQKNYTLQEEIILKRQRILADEDQLLIYIKLLSSKGVSFTAGILSISSKQLLKHSTPVKSPLNKPIDAHSFVQYYVQSTIQDETSIQYYLPLQSSKYTHSTKSLPEQIDHNSDLQLKIRQLQLELQSVRTAYQLLKLRNIRDHQQKAVNGGRDIFAKEHQKWQQMLEQCKKNQKQMLNRIQILQVQNIKSSSLSLKQKEIILMLQNSQKLLNQQRLELKAQAKAHESQLEQKRTRIRDLESQKLNLMMKVLTNDKQITFMRERVYQNILRLYKKALKINKSKQQNISQQKLNSFASFQASVYRKEGQSQSSYKINSPCHKHAIKDQAPWLQQSLIYRQNGLLEISESSGMNDISISNIRQKNKEVSLLNSGMFLKASQTLNKTTNIFKSISDQVKLYCSKIIDIFMSYHQTCQKQLINLKEAHKKLCQNNNQYQKNEQSLLGHLQQLQGGLQSQLQMVNQKGQMLSNAEQNIRFLELQLQEKNQLISQLQAAVYNLQEEKQELKNEIHQNNYEYAKREEQLMISFKNLEISPPKHNFPFTPLIKDKRHSRKEKLISPQQIYPQFYNEHIADYRQKIKQLQLQLSHERYQCKELRHVIENAQGERRKLQFAIKLKQRIQILNESIYLSQQQSQLQRQKQEQQKSKQYQQEILKVLI